MTYSVTFNKLNWFIRCLNLIGFGRENSFRPTSKGDSMATNAARPESRPILFSLEVEKGSVLEIVNDLHLFAREVNFTRVSDIRHLTGVEVIPGQSNKNDPWRSFKLDAYLKIKSGKSAICVPPLEVIGFSCELENGQLMNVGLCRYPQFVIQPSTGKSIRTFGEDIWGWQSSVRSCCGGYCGFHTCITSHKAVVTLLEYAAALGIVSSVDDPTNYYYDHWEAQLERTCHSVCGDC